MTRKRVSDGISIAVMMIFFLKAIAWSHIAMRKKKIPHEFRIRDGGHTLDILESFIAGGAEFCFNDLSPVLIILNQLTFIVQLSRMKKNKLQILIIMKAAYSFLVSAGTSACSINLIIW